MEQEEDKLLCEQPGIEEYMKVIAASLFGIRPSEEQIEIQTLYPTRQLTDKELSEYYS